MRSDKLEIFANAHRMIEFTDSFCSGVVTRDGDDPDAILRENPEAWTRRDRFRTIKEVSLYTPEQKMIDREEHLDVFIQDELQQIGRLAAALPDEQERKWDILNRFFLSELNSL